MWSLLGFLLSFLSFFLGGGWWGGGVSPKGKNLDQFSSFDGDDGWLFSVNVAWVEQITRLGFAMQCRWFLCFRNHQFLFWVVWAQTRTCGDWKQTADSNFSPTLWIRVSAELIPIFGEHLPGAQNVYPPTEQCFQSEVILRKHASHFFFQLSQLYIVTSKQKFEMEFTQHTQACFLQWRTRGGSGPQKSFQPHKRSKTGGTRKIWSQPPAVVNF